MSALIDSNSPLSLKEKGIGKDIQTIRPNSGEGRRIIALCHFEFTNLYRIDYGNTPFRIVFGLSNEDRMAYIFMFDTSHETFSGKQKK
jgi:hypothetical protein